MKETCLMDELKPLKDEFNNTTSDLSLNKLRPPHSNQKMSPIPKEDQVKIKDWPKFPNDADLTWYHNLRNTQEANNRNKPKYQGNMAVNTRPGHWPTNKNPKTQIPNCQNFGACNSMAARVQKSQVMPVSFA